jgi:predicted DCC family thiol-disulfide oxidoreductase YuxK
VELPGPVAFIDGVCVVCERSARSLMARDEDHVLRYATLQGETAAALQAERADFPTDLGTFVLAEPDATATGGLRLHVRTDAILRALDLTGGRSGPARWFGRLPRALRDGLYRAFVRLRYRLYGRKDTCDLPTARQRALLLP